MTKIKVKFFRELVNLCKKLTSFSCLTVNSYFIIHAFKTYEKGKDFLSNYLEIERSKDE